jgi:hypothetical protein
VRQCDHTRGAAVKLCSFLAYLGVLCEILLNHFGVVQLEGESGELTMEIRRIR